MQERLDFAFRNAAVPAFPRVGPETFCPLTWEERFRKLFAKNGAFGLPAVFRGVGSVPVNNLDSKRSCLQKT